MTYGDLGILHDLKPPMKATVVRWIFQVAQFFPTFPNLDPGTAQSA